MYLPFAEFLLHYMEVLVFIARWLWELQNDKKK